MNNPSETSKPSMESGDGNTGKNWLIDTQVFLSSKLNEYEKLIFFFFASVQEQQLQKYCRREAQKAHIAFQGQGEFLHLLFLETWEHCMSLYRKQVISHAVCRALLMHLSICL